MKWYWWVLIAVVVIAIIWVGYSMYSKSKDKKDPVKSTTLTTSGPTEDTATVSVENAETGDGQKVVVIKKG